MYPITSPRLKIDTKEESSTKVIADITRRLKTGEMGKDSSNDEELLVSAIGAAATRPQLDALYNIAKTNFNTLNVHNAYLSHLTTIGFPLDAVATYEALTQSGVEPCKSILISAYCKSEQIEKALDLYAKLKSSNTRINTKVYKSFMNYYFDQGEMRKGFAIFDEMRANKLPIGISCYNALLRGYRMCANIDKFEETFKKMKARGIKPDVISHTERIILWGKAKKMGEMIVKLQDMKEEGIQPTHVTYNAMVWLFMRNTHWESAAAILETMTRERQLPLDMKAVTKLVTYYADKRRFDEARWLIEMAKKEGNSVTHMLHMLTPQYGIVDDAYWKDPMNKVSEWPY